LASASATKGINLSVAGLFAGIGGFERAFSAAGHRVSLLADSDLAAQAVLRAHFPDVELHGDVTDLFTLPADTEIVTAGFPCQNLSMAGDKGGFSGAKSGVVNELFRLLIDSGSPTVVIENVYFMLHLNRGLAMHALAARFEGLGYRWAYRVVDTMSFGLPQRRRRVYFVASKTLNPAEVLFADDAAVKPPPVASLDVPLGFYWTEGRSGVGLAVDAIPPLKCGSGLGIASAPAVLFPDGQVLTPGASASERLQGFPVGWTSPAADFGRHPEGRLIGNSVSVPAARWVAERLIKPGQVLGFALESLRAGASWPDAAWNLGDGRSRVIASSSPLGVGPESIETFRDASWKPLSHRALSGFIRRAGEGGLKFPPGFIDALSRSLDGPKRLAA
jgi:DNA (cytosine-5)-methyltransferase 1